MIRLRNIWMLSFLLLFMQWATAVHAAEHAGEIDAPVEICAVCASPGHHAAPPATAPVAPAVYRKQRCAPQLDLHRAEAPAHSAYLSRGPPALI